MVVLLALAFSLASGAQAVSAQDKPLSEADVLKLIQLKNTVDAFRSRLDRQGIDFAVNEAVLQRFREAGASEELLVAIQLQADYVDPELKTIMAWTSAFWAGEPNHLHAKLSINGAEVATFDNPKQVPIGKYLNKGWNTICVETKPASDQEYGDDAYNHLAFHIGPTHKDPNEDLLVMQPTLLQFHNGGGWEITDGKFVHALGAHRKSVALSYRFYLTGQADEKTRIAEGDYVLQFKPFWDGDQAPITTTVFVNGTPFDTFVNPVRHFIITPALNKGENTLKIVTHRVPNELEDNDITVIVGKAKWHVADREFKLSPIVEVEANKGWVRSEASGQLENRVQPGADFIERTVTFQLDEDPKGNDG
jgi:hypothetical protein